MFVEFLNGSEDVSNTMFPAMVKSLFKKPGPNTCDSMLNPPAYLVNLVLVFGRTVFLSCLLNFVLYSLYSFITPVPNLKLCSSH